MAVYDQCPSCGNNKTIVSALCNSCRHQERRREAGVSEEGRICSSCGLFKPWSDFYANNQRGANGKQAQCIECRRIYKTAPRHKGWSGCTNADRDALLFIQDGVCANEGCRNEATVMDHDYDTGEFRAMLCQSCNIALGQLEETPDRIRGLARYAEQCQNVKATACRTKGELQ